MRFIRARRAFFVYGDAPGKEVTNQRPLKTSSNKKSGQPEAGSGQCTWETQKQGINKAVAVACTDCGQNKCDHAVRNRCEDCHDYPGSHTRWLSLFVIAHDRAIV